MTEKRTFRVASKRAPIDALISYHTDAKSLVVDHRSWIGKHHAEKDAFVGSVITSLDAVLTASATSSKEVTEAVAATTYQDTVLQRAGALANGIRKRGEFIANELELTEEGRLEAPKVRAACGVASRVNIQRQTGLRRLLLIQQAGLGRIAKLWADWNPQVDGQPSDVERVTRALGDIEGAIKSQAKEQVEAQMALDDLEERALLAVDSMNRVIRLVNSVFGEIPAPLHAGLVSLETQHSGVFWSQGEPEKPAAPTPPTDAPNRAMD